MEINELQAKLEQLVALKSQVEMLSEQRKERQNELLEGDEVYSNFKALEKEKQEEYDALREEVAKLGKEQNLNGKIETQNGAVSFSYVKTYVLENEEKFRNYCLTRNLLDTVYKMEIRKTEFKKLAQNADAEGQMIDGVEAVEDVAIQVSTKK